jgi:hypothetical protein
LILGLGMPRDFRVISHRISLDRVVEAVTGLWAGFQGWRPLELHFWLF